MNNDTDHFNKAAKEWDNDPVKILRAKAVADAIIKIVSPTDKMSALEFGSGTGQLSFMLQPLLKSITLIDESSEMLKVADSNIKRNNIQNMTTKQINILSENYHDKFDLIFTLMVLHHIKDTNAIISKLHTLLNNGGYLCIADLVEEDGSFHSHLPEFDGHNGYNIEELSKIIKTAGFNIINTNICFTITKETKTGNKKYPVFVIIAAS